MKRCPESPREVILLLHGLGERGKRIFRKLTPYLPDDALIIAPNAPFPLPRQKEGRISYGHSWYFYDKFEKTYFLNQDLAKHWLRDLLALENPQKLPVKIIGFSQGGYLAPLVGEMVKETKLVIGLSCEFRTTLIKEKLPFPLYAVQGGKDEIVTLSGAKKEAEALKETLGLEVQFRELPEVGHEINSSVGKTVQAILEEHGKSRL